MLESMGTKCLKNIILLELMKATKDRRLWISMITDGVQCESKKAVPTKLLEYFHSGLVYFRQILPISCQINRPKLV